MNEKNKGLISGFIIGCLFIMLIDLIRWVF